MIGRKYTGDGTVLPHFVFRLYKGAWTLTTLIHVRKAGASSCFLATIMCSLFSRKERREHILKVTLGTDRVVRVRVTSTMVFNVCIVVNYPRSLPSLSNTQQLVKTKIDDQQIQQRQYKINITGAIDIIRAAKNAITLQQPQQTNPNSSKLPEQSIRCVSCVGCLLQKVG